MTKIISFTAPKELIERVDLRRGDVPRSKFIIRALRRVLDNAEIQS
jgi:metal-responsive CopG/Arc/MetJ family transcriptional regulator